MKKIFFLTTITIVAFLILSACYQPPTPQIVKVYITTTPELIQSTVPSEKPTTQVPDISLIGCVGDTSLRIRDKPTTESNLIGGLSPNECVTVMGRSKDSSWGWIVSDNIAGWVSLNYLILDGTISKLPIADGTNLSRSSIIGSSSLPTRTLRPTARPTLKPTDRPLYPTATPKSSVLLCSQTGNSVGSYVTCKIPRAYCSYQSGIKGKPTFCNDARYPNHSFTMVKWGSDWSSYNGQCIFVSGVVSWYDGKPQIEVTSRSQISGCQ